MRKCFVAIAAVICGCNAALVSAQTMPLGVPHPAGNVPTAIMPNLPTASDQSQAFPYDPIGMATPEWSDGSSQYYIDGGASNCSDSANGGRGSPQQPRCSLRGQSGQSWNLEAGDQLFIVGDGQRYGGDVNIESASMPGTAQSPIWIVGLGDTLPELRFGRFFWTRATHVIIESVHFASPQDSFRMVWANATGPIEYNTFRHVKCSGSQGTHSEPSRRCFSVGGTSQNPHRYVVFYDVELWGLGRWQDDRTTGRDMLGIQMQKWTRYVWILDSKIYHMQGDSVMCGNSQWFDYDKSSRPHYIYIGGNEFYENYENAYDQKGCYHVVFSENNVHDFYNSFKSANETAIITEQDSEGDVGGRFSWFINNLIEDTGTAFAAKATTDDAYIYILGNLVRRIDSSALDFVQRCYSGGSGGTTCPLGFTFAQNTIDCGLDATAITNVQNPVGSNQDVVIDGNIFYNCRDGSQGSPHNWESFSDGPLDLQHVQNVHYRSSGGGISLDSRRYDVLSNNVFNQNPQFNNGAAGDYSLASSSPAASWVTQPNDAYSLFQSMYGIDIRVDRNGNAWPTSGPVDAGAFQGSGGPGAPRPNPPQLGIQ
jgi:hypothetical protein